MCYERSLLRKSLKYWRASFASHKLSVKEAQHAGYFFLARRYLMKWHRESIRVRKQKRQQALDSQLQKRRLELTKRYLTHWQRRTRNCLELQEISNETRREKDVDLVQEIFSYWTDRLQYVARLEDKASKVYRLQLLRFRLN
jgi:hypothetical protein